MLPLRSLAVVLLAGTLTLPVVDDFGRERGGRNDAAKDALEGAPAPALSVDRWLNSEPLELADLVGQVVVIEFWGTW